MPSKPAKPPATACEREGHAYTLVEDSQHYEFIGNDTHVHRAFCCSRCGEVIDRVIGVWKDFKPQRQQR